ncbi:MAG TPA: alpha/beta hydrolase [Nitriliruptoraceae bacterium]|nr:alpha/beta hydrolase [Nitriliruptoraceae bacterium]
MTPPATGTPAGRAPDEMLQVPVEGGDLTVGRWGSGPVRAVLSHGITANHRSFDSVASALADRGIGVVAVDHRGRGGSADVPGPFGLRAHAADLVTVADAVDAHAPVAAGHSMGAWVVANAAELAPRRWSGIVAIDGALPAARDVPPDADVEAVLAETIGPALARLDMEFDSVEAVMELWRRHPSVGPIVDAAADYLRWDLHEVDGTWRSRVAKDAVLADGRAILVDSQAATALARTSVPSTLLWAPRGMLDEPPGFLPAEAIAALVDPLPHVTSVAVDDVNHYSIVFDAAAVGQIADAVVGHLE